ncbi:MAG TPA: ABC transporter [Myxococcales bacterium]|jgi:ubiquinone biosynthesis protein|nr:ABC transporter [Myxococcales bacterium]
MIRQAFKDLSRLREISLVALRHGFGELLDRTRLWEVLGRKERQEPRPESGHESTARRFRLFLSELGPTFVKLGQVLSTRADLLPREFIQELSTLQDAVPPEDMAHVRSQIEKSFGRPIEQVFASFEETPLASASIAQVHRATTRDGREVVVKVQRPDIAERVRADLDLLYYAARILEAVVEETGVYSPTGIIEEFDVAIREELDFLNEAKNLRDFGETHRDRPRITIPKVYDDLSNSTVLTMEYVVGQKLRGVDLAQHDRKLLAETLLEGAFHQLFDDGLFHGDPHPGNILVLPEERVALLDLGVVGRLTKQMQENLILLVMAVALKDADTVARLLYRVATPDQRTNLAAFKTDIQAVLDQYLAETVTLAKIDTNQLIPELLNLAVRYHVRIPKEYAILSRAAVTVEGLIRGLYPEINIGKAVLPYAKELLVGRYETMGVGITGMRALLRLQTFATDVPMQLSQILLDLESGKFSVNLASEDLVRIHQSLKGLGFVAFLGFLACGLTIGAFISFSKLDFAFHGVPVLGALALLLIGMLFGAVALWSLSSGKGHKISVTRWLERRQRRK